MPAPTPPTEIQMQEMTEKLASEFLMDLQKIFSNAENINEAVLDRGMLINEPGKGNVATLATVADQFDAQGNQIPGSLYTYHEPERRDREKANLLRSTDISDRENIALASAYFKAGIDIMQPYPGNIFVNKIINILRPTIANELRNVVGFTDGLSYTPRNDMKEKIADLLQPQNLDLLAEKIFKYYQIMPQLTQMAAKAKTYADTHWEKALSKNPAPDKRENIDFKKQLLTRTHAAVKEFVETANAEKFLAEMQQVTALNKSRTSKGLGFKTETTDMINKIYKLAQSNLIQGRAAKSGLGITTQGLFASKSGSPSEDKSKSPSRSVPDTDDDTPSPKSPHSPK